MSNARGVWKTMSDTSENAELLKALFEDALGHCGPNAKKVAEYVKEAIDNFDPAKKDDLRHFLGLMWRPQNWETSAEATN